MNPRIGNSVAAETQRNVVAALQGAGNTAGALAEVMTGMVVFALRGARAPREQLDQAAVGTITGGVQGLAQVGSEPGEVSRALMTGVLRGVRRVGRLAPDLVDECADTLVADAPPHGSPPRAG